LAALRARRMIAVAEAGSAARRWAWRV